METLTDYKCCSSCPVKWLSISNLSLCVEGMNLFSLPLMASVTSVLCVLEALNNHILCVHSYFLYVLWSFVFTILYHSLFFFLFFWEKLLENCPLLAVTFHMEYNVNFLFSIVATYARMEIPHTVYFSSLFWIAVTAPCCRKSCVCVLSHSVVSDSLWP